MFAFSFVFSSNICANQMLFLSVFSVQILEQIRYSQAVLLERREDQAGGRVLAGHSQPPVASQTAQQPRTTLHATGGLIDPKFLKFESSHPVCTLLLFYICSCI